jgi:hypothetical protein
MMFGYMMFGLEQVASLPRRVTRPGRPRPEPMATLAAQPRLRIGSALAPFLEDTFATVANSIAFGRSLD